MMREPACISEALWPGEWWLTQQWQSGPDVHFCPRHADPERRARLAEGYMLVCARCERTSKHEPRIKRWWNVNKHGERITVCDDCHVPGRDAMRWPPGS